MELGNSYGIIHQVVRKVGRAAFGEENSSSGRVRTRPRHKSW